jgi:hypothetical protein
MSECITQLYLAYCQHLRPQEKKHFAQANRHIAELVSSSLVELEPKNLAPLPLSRRLSTNPRQRRAASAFAEAQRRRWQEFREARSLLSGRRRMWIAM